MIRANLIVIPGDFASSIEASGADWGLLDVRSSDAERVDVAYGWTAKEHQLHTVDNHQFREGLEVWSVVGRDAGQLPWYRVAPEFHEGTGAVMRRGGTISLDRVREEVSGWRHIVTGHRFITVAAAADPPRWRAWILVEDRVIGLPVAVTEPDLDLLEPLRGRWPAEQLAERKVLVVGAGSIGAAASQALLGYGVRRQVLVDHDHLLPHNFARHRLTREQVGRLKVRALADELRRRDPRAEPEAYDFDVVGDADLLRAHMVKADAVLVATDTVASRRIVNHVATWARRPAVFACVLEDAGVGEIFRYRPYATGCLWCLREGLVESGALDPEPQLDAGYGDQIADRPTTSVASDLWVSGELAAKLVVATLLEGEGKHDQRAPGDHALLGLRPRPEVPPPFDLDNTGELRWRPGPTPRSNCPSCGPDAATTEAL